MIRKYIATGSPLFVLGDRACDAGEIIELPTQLANHPVAMGALRLAPPDAELTLAAQSDVPPVAPLDPLVPAKPAKAKKTK